MSSLQEQAIFFMDHLVPAGQLLEIFLRQPQVKKPEVSADHFDVLNLVASYAIHPRMPELQALTKLVDEYSSTLLDALSGPKSRSTSTQARRLEAVDAAWQRLRQDLRSAIGYGPTVRHHWLNEYVDRTHPLTLNGRTGKWRTFVRDMPWTRTAEMLKSTPHAAAMPKAPETFGCRVGREKARELWEKCFTTMPSLVIEKPATPPASETAVSIPSPEKAPGSVVQCGAAPPASVPEATKASELAKADAPRLPEGVTVANSAGGQLVVSARFDPRSFLTLAQRKRSASADAQLSAQLAVQTFRRHCPYTELAAVIDAVNTWLAERSACKDAVLADYVAWEARHQAKQLQDKFTASFSATERAKLIELVKSGALAHP